MGRKSRNKGAAFERESRGLLASLTGWEKWRRTESGQEQRYGDLVREPCRECRLAPGWPEDIVVECKRRHSLTTGMLDKWWNDTVAKAEALGCDLQRPTAVVLIARGDFCFPIVIWRIGHGRPFRWTVELQTRRRGCLYIREG